MLRKNKLGRCSPVRGWAICTIAASSKFHSIGLLEMQFNPGHSKTMNGATSGPAIEWLDPTARNSKRLPVQAK